MNIKNILGIVPSLQATTLMIHNIPKKFSLKPPKKMDMKKQSKGIVKRGITTLIGIGLIKPTAKIISDL